MAAPAAARFDRVARAVAPQRWRGMTARRRRRPAVEEGCAGRGGARGARQIRRGMRSDGGRRGAVSKRRRGRGFGAGPWSGW